MPMGILYWMIFVIWVLFGGYSNRGRPFFDWGGDLILFILLFIIGWKLFGFVIQ
jgi:hypothetical protein